MATVKKLLDVADRYDRAADRAAEARKHDRAHCYRMLANAKRAAAAELSRAVKDAFGETDAEYLARRGGDW